MAQSDPALKRKEAVTKGGAKVATSHHSRSPVTTPEEALEAITLIMQVLREEGVAVDGIDFPAARLADTILKARDRGMRIAERKKQLVPLAAVKAHAEKAFTGYKRAIQGMPARYASQMAAELGCDAGRLDAAMGRMIHETLLELSAPVVRS